ncbi:hypothetical protein NL676_012035 [Syzygium grande]|nr:hypothetical protein NL676_012035 [Syzygium grande]
MTSPDSAKALFSPFKSIFNLGSSLEALDLWWFNIMLLLLLLSSSSSSSPHSDETTKRIEICQDRAAEEATKQARAVNGGGAAADGGARRGGEAKAKLSLLGQKLHLAGDTDPPMTVRLARVED